jgi:hypothetical protein
VHHQDVHVAVLSVFDRLAGPGGDDQHFGVVLLLEDRCEVVEELGVVETRRRGDTKLLRLHGGRVGCRPGTAADQHEGDHHGRNGKNNSFMHSYQLDVSQYVHLNRCVLS